MAEESSGNRGPVLATIATSSDGWFRAVSPHFLAMVGGPVEALTGVNAFDLVHPMQAAAMRRALLSASTVDEQVFATQLYLGDTWTPVEIVIERMIDERSTWRLYPVAEATGPSLPSEPAEQTAAVTPAALDVDRHNPPAVSLLSDVESASGSAVVAEATSSGEPAVRDASEATSALDATVSLSAKLPHGSTGTATVDHESYVAMLPADGVPEQRDAVRRSVGGSSTPVVEIDVDGRTTYVSGAWDELSSRGRHGADVFEELLERSGQADDVLASISQTFETAEPSNHSLATSDLSPRWVRVLPIPSPHLAGVVHALVAVVDQSAIDATTPVAVDAPSGELVRAGNLASAVGPEANKLSDATAESASSATGSDESKPDTQDLLSSTDPETSRSSGLRWVGFAVGLILLAAVLFLLVTSLRSDGEAAQVEPVPLNLIDTERVQVTNGQSWQAIGAESLGEMHALAATSDGGYAAEVSGRLFRLDVQGAAVEVISVRASEATLISDIDADDSDVAWVLDGGVGRVSRVTPQGDVTVVATDPALRNARGIGVGLDNSVFIAATASAQLMQYGIDGQLVRTIALSGRQPSDVAQATDGSLWVVDAEQLELVHLSEQGEVLSAVALEPFSSLQSPHLAIDSTVLWMTAPESSAVLAIDLETGQLTGERVDLTRPDGAPVNKPIGIAATADDRLWIADSTGGAIVIVGSAPS